MLASGTLARFQNDFADALLATNDIAPRSMAALTAQPAFAVYRNTVMKGCIDALLANYPAVTRLVGEEWMRAAAAIYVRSALPALPMLLQYGDGFADFLARFEPAAELPYLPGVARLDRCWTEAHAADDESTLDTAAIRALSSANFFNVRLEPHAAARWAWFADAPVHTIWSRNRSDEPVDAEPVWQAEGTLVTRPHDAVQWTALNQAGCAFLDVCAAGGTVADAAQSALAADARADLAELIVTLLAAGAFSRLRPCRQQPTEESQ